MAAGADAVLDPADGRRQAARAAASTSTTCSGRSTATWRLRPARCALATPAADARAQAAVGLQRAFDQVGLADEVGDEARWPAHGRAFAGADLLDARRRSSPRSRSAMVIASSWSWVTKMKAMPSACCSCLSSICMRLRSFRSSALSGSSSSSSLGRFDQRARERDALLLAAGELARQPVRHAFQADQRRAPRDAQLAAPRHCDAAAARAVGDVVEHAHVRKQRVVLEHRVDAAGGTAAPRRRRRHRPPAFRCPAATKPRDAAQQRGLAASARAEQRDELALRHVERQLVQDLARRRRTWQQPADGKQWLRHGLQALARDLAVPGVDDGCALPFISLQSKSCRLRTDPPSPQGSLLRRLGLDLRTLHRGAEVELVGQAAGGLRRQRGVDELAPRPPCADCPSPDAGVHRSPRRPLSARRSHAAGPCRPGPRRRH